MTPDELPPENEELRRRLAEAEGSLAAISGAETVYRAAVETMSEAVVSTTAEGAIIFCNARFTEFVATRVEDVVGHALADFVPEPDRESMRALLEECVRTPIEQRVVLVAPGGAHMPVVLTGRAQGADGGATLCLVAADRTEPERQLANVERLKGLYAVLSHVNEAILRTRDPNELFEAACRIAVEDGGLVLAWIGFVDAASGRVRVAAKAGRDDGYLDNINISVDPDLPEGRGPTAIALRECRPFINNDTANNPFMAPWREAQLARGLASSASFPLVVNGSCAGVITLYAGEPGYFDDEEARLLAALADDFSFALAAAEVAEQRELAVAGLRRARDELERRVEERTKELSSLYEEQASMTEELQAQTAELTASLGAQARLTSELERELDTTQALLQAADATATLGLEAILSRIAELMAQRLGRDRVVLHLVESERSIRTMAAHGLRVLNLGEVQRLDDYSPELQEATMAGKPVVVDFRRDDISETAKREREKLQAEVVLYVPLLFHGRLVGVVTVDDARTYRPFTDREIEIALGLAAQAAVAIENARLFEAQNAELSRTRLLQDVALAASRGPRLAAVTDSILLALREDLHLKGGDIRVVDGGRLRLVAWFNYPKENVDLLRDVDLAASAMLEPRAVRERRILTHEDDVVTPERRRLLELQGVLDDRYAYVPITFAEEAVGLLALTFESRRPFSEAELATFTAVAQIAGQAITNADFFEAEREGLRLSSALNRVDEVVHSSLDFDEIMDGIVVEVREALEVDAAIIQLRRDGYWEFAHDVGLTPELRASKPRDEETPLSMSMVETREPVIVNDVRADDRVDPEIMERFGIKSLLGAPIISRDQVIGVVLADRFDEVKPFTDQQVDFMRRAAATLGLALDNARLYQTEHDIADRLQSGLLALPDEIHGIEFARAYHSATESARVGGDFFDLFELDEDHVGAIIGDVSGKGLDAAVLTSTIKSTIRAYAVEAGRTPKEILDLTNEVIYKATGTGTFVTVFFGIVDRRDGTLVYGNAGHTTAALIGGGAIEGLSVTGPLLGALDDVRYGEAEARLGVGETLFLYTDGLTETRRDGELYGEERVFDFLTSKQEMSPSDLVYEVVEEVLAFGDGQLRDDLAILAVRRTAPAQ